MTPREIVRRNIEFAGEDCRIGFNFSGEGRLRDFAGAGYRFPDDTKRWEEGGFEYYTDIWGNVWYRMLGLSKGGEVHRPAIEDWRDLDRLRLPDLDNPAYYEGARKLCASDTDRFRVGGMSWPFAVFPYIHKI